MSRSHYLPYIALFIGIICIGHSAIFITIANVPGSTASFYRLLFATIAMVPLWVFRGRRIPPRRDILLILGGAFFFSLDFLFWNTAILLTSAATATLLANSAPIWVGLISMIVFKEKLSQRFWLGLIIAIVGLNVLFGLDAWRTMIFNRGDLLSIVAGFFYALYLLFTLDSRKRLDTITFMTFSVVFMTILLFIFNLLLRNPFGGFPKESWYALVAVGLISHVGGWVSINYALGHLKGVNVSVTLLSQTVVTAILALVLLNESLDSNQIVGGLLVLVGIYTVNRRRANWSWLRWGKSPRTMG